MTVSRSANCRGGRAATSRRSATTSASACCRRRRAVGRFGAEDVGRLAFVRRARELGFTLDEVRVLLSLAVEGQGACAEVRGLAAAHLADVRAKIADLRAMERALAEAVHQCDAGETPGCPLIAALSSAAS
jgi:MerR family transcriptional regulator, mercuric resistance operon regulatory protein